MPWDKSANEIRHRLKDPGGFDQNSFRTKEISPGVNLVMGKMMGSDTMEPQSIRFDSGKFDMAKAQKWMKEHWDKQKMMAAQDGCMDGMPIDNKDNKDMAGMAYSIHGVEIFSAGTWNGDEYTVSDLKGMVDVFEKHKKAVRPFVKLGHDEKQQLLQNDGLPAAGWIDRLYMKGEKLLADFVDVPKKIYELIQKKAYRKVSSEIYWNIKIGDSVHKHMLGAVALLGADTPGCMNLNDILGMYKKQGFQEIKTYAELDEVDKRTYQTANLQGDSMSTEEKVIENDPALVAELDVLKTFKAEAEKKALEMQAELEQFRKEATQAKLEKYVSELKSEKLITPAMEPLVKEFMGPEKKEYSLADKQVSKEDLLKEMLKLHSVASTVNLEENSVVGKNKAENKDAELEKEAQELANREKISYGQALKRLFSSKQLNKE